MQLLLVVRLLLVVVMVGMVVGMERPGASPRLYPQTPGRPGIALLPLPLQMHHSLRLLMLLHGLPLRERAPC